MYRPTTPQDPPFTPPLVVEVEDVVGVVDVGSASLGGGTGILERPGPHLGSGETGGVE